MRQNCHERKELNGELDSHWPLKIKNSIRFAHVETTLGCTVFGGPIKVKRLRDAPHHMVAPLRKELPHLPAQESVLCTATGSEAKFDFRFLLCSA